MGQIPAILPGSSRQEGMAVETQKPSACTAGGSKGLLPEAEKMAIDDEIVFVAACPTMREVRRQVRQVADFDIPVLLLGESGTGKGVVARMIHAQSRRAQQTFMKVNCAALPGELLESELFGYEAGAFTGATRAKPGRFQVCNKGTILLDEIVDIPVSLQAKLLHVLQDGEFARLGSTSSTKVDVRTIAATNHDISKAIREGRFREDLFYRMNAYTIFLPPLRERREDIPELMIYFMAFWARKFKRPQLAFSPALLDACLDYSWPGNIRELENFVQRYLIAGEEACALKQLEFNSNGNGHPSRASQSPDRAGVPAWDLKSKVRGLKKVAEREAIIRALELTGGNRKEAARILGISVRALQYKVREIQSDQGGEGEPLPSRRYRQAADPA
jgi:two-component system response regulator AtoC